MMTTRRTARTPSATATGLMALALLVAAPAVRAETIAVSGAGLTLRETVRLVREKAPAMLYVVAGGVEKRLDVDLSAPSRDELMERAIELFGARGTVVGDLWIVEGTPPSAALVDARSSLIELLPPGDPVREALADPQGHPIRPGAEILAELARPLERPQPPDGYHTVRGLTVGPDNPLYGELRVALLNHWLRSASKPEDPLPRIRTLRAEGSELRGYWTLPGDPTLEHTFGAEPAPGPPRAEIDTLGPDLAPWHIAHPLGQRATLALEADLGAVLAALASVAGVEIREGPLDPGLPLSISATDLPVGTALVAVCAALGVPVGLKGYCEEYTLGRSCVENAYCAQAHPDLRLWHKSDPWLTVESTLQSATPEEWALLRGDDGVRVDDLSPAVRHALRRTMAHDDIVDPDSLDEHLDAVLARADVHALLVYSSRCGDTVARVAITSTADTTWDLGPHLGATGLEAPGRRYGGSLRGLGGSAPGALYRYISPVMHPPRTREQIWLYAPPPTAGPVVPPSGGEAADPSVTRP